MEDETIVKIGFAIIIVVCLAVEPGWTILSLLALMFLRALS